MRFRKLMKHILTWGIAISVVGCGLPAAQAASSGDRDRDGIPDAWEEHGYDADGDGVNDGCTGCTCPTGCSTSTCPTVVEPEDLKPVCYRIWVDNEGNEVFKRLLEGRFDQLPVPATESSQALLRLAHSPVLPDTATSDTGSASMDIIVGMGVGVAAVVVVERRAAAPTTPA